MALRFIAGFGRRGNKARAPEKITGLSLSYSHMARTSYFRYELKKNGVKTLFSCYYFNADCDEVKLENVSVAFRLYQPHAGEGKVIAHEQHLKIGF